jgi:Carboxypeptidase regulatory-like domain
VLDPQNLNVTAAGENVTGISAALQPGPVISGTVTNSAGHKLSGICVLVSTPAGALFGFVQSGSGGRYAAPDLAPGSYEVVFAPGCGNNTDLAEEAFRSRVSGAADTVSVTTGTLSGIDAVMQPAGGISGVIRAANGHPVQLSCLYLTGVSGPAKSLSGEALIFGRKYELLGGYQVTFLPTCVSSALDTQWYKEKPSPVGATTVVVRAFRTDPQIDSLLHIGGSIAGRITSGGKPVRNMCVYAQNVSQFVEFGAASSNRNGQYDIHGLNTGFYELEVAPCGNGSNALAAEVLPQLVHVTAPARTSGVKTTAVLGATISGKVLVSPPPADAGAAGACVEAFETNGDAYNSSFVGLDGTYSITNLPPGQYHVYVGDPGCSFSEPNLAPQWYLGEASEILSTPVSLTVGGTTTLSTVTLANDGSISGSATGQGGKPLPGVCVAATAAGSVPVYSVTSSAGSYSIAGLPAGRYRVQFSSGCGATGYRTQWWRDKPTARAATFVTVTAGTATTGITAALKK